MVTGDRRSTLGRIVNSPYNDDTPFITENGEKLYFSSYGHYNMGGYDIFLSKKQANGQWAKPVNMGYPINTTDDDQFYMPIKDGQVAYYSRYSPEGHGKMDIYRYIVYSTDNPRMFPIAGLLNYMGERIDSSEVTISVLSAASGDTVTVINPSKDGRFRFSVPAGNYNMVFDSNRFRSHMQKLNVAENSPHEGFTIPGEIMLVPVTPALTAEEVLDILELRDTLISIDEAEEVKVRFQAEKDTKAIVNVYNNNKLVKTDTIDVNRRRQSYEFVPEPGHNKVVITVQDENGNTVQKSADVYLNKAEEPAKR